MLQKKKDIATQVVNYSLNLRMWMAFEIYRMKSSFFKQEICII